MEKTQVMEHADALSNFLDRNREDLYEYNKLCREARTGESLNVELLQYAYKKYKFLADTYRLLKYRLHQAKKAEALFKKANTPVDPYEEPEWVKMADPAAAEGFYHPDRTKPFFSGGVPETPSSPVSSTASA